MAVEAELPQWLTIVGGGLGLIITTVVVRLGWNKTAEATGQPEQGRLIGALVDAASVRELTLAVQSHAEVLRNATDETGKELRTHSDELRNLGDEVRRLGNKLENRA